MEFKTAPNCGICLMNGELQAVWDGVSVPVSIFNEKLMATVLQIREYEKRIPELCAEYVAKLEASNRLNDEMKAALQMMLVRYPASTFCEVDCLTTSPCEYCQLEKMVHGIILGKQAIEKPLREGLCTNDRDGEKCLKLAGHEGICEGPQHVWDWKPTLGKRTYPEKRIEAVQYCDHGWANDNSVCAFCRRPFMTAKQWIEKTGKDV